MIYHSYYSYKNEYYMSQKNISDYKQYLLGS